MTDTVRFAGSSSSSTGSLQSQLPPALQLHVMSFLPPTDRAICGRLVSPDAAAGLSKDPTCTASLSQPLPPHAVPWALEAEQQHVQQLPFRHKPQLLCTAAVSGSEVNLEVALALLQPSIFPELLHQMRDFTTYPNPGVAAVEASHPQLLGWLVRHCPALLADRRDILRAAAQHCDMAGLQVACDALRQEDAGEGRANGSREDDQGPVVSQCVLDAAATSATPDAVAKMEWLLAVEGGRCLLQESTAVAAARSGDLGGCASGAAPWARAWSFGAPCSTLTWPWRSGWWTRRGASCPQQQGRQKVGRGSCTQQLGARMA